MSRRLAAAAAAALVALAATALLWALWWAPGPRPGPHVVIVRQGSTLASVADQLAAIGAIPGNALTFRALARLVGSSDPIQAGEFAIPRGTGGARLLDLLQHGRPIQRLVTIPEGMPSIMVREKLAALPFLTGPVPPAAEGSLLPDSYGYQRGETRGALLRRMDSAMERELDRLWQTRKPTSVVTTRAQAVNLAAIVEKETAKPSERRMIAGVYSNRLRIGMKLDADPTVIYPISRGKPLGRRIRRSELAADNGYNTYRRAGLPAGPIANPGRMSIAAVLDPAPTSALYFVADGRGGHVFADSLAEHQANVARWYALRRARGEM